MRSFPIVLTLLVAAAPAAAQPPKPERPSAADAARLLENPAVQDGAARALTQLAGIVLDTRVGPLAALADPDGDIRPNDTLRDLKRRDDPQYERHLYRDTKRALGTAGAVAGGVAAETDELRRTAARLHDALAPLIGALAPAGGDRPSDY